MAQEYKNVNENYGDPVACTYEELCDVLRMFQADDPTINGRHLVVAGDAVVELSHDDPLHREVIAKEAPWHIRAEQRLADKKAGRFYTSEED